LISVLLVQTPDLVRSALAAVLAHEADLHVVADIGRDDEIPTLAANLRPDVIIIDADLDDSGSAQVNAVAEKLPDSAVVVLTGRVTPDAMTRAVSAGVRALVGRDSQPRELIGVIRRVAAGERVIAPSVVVAALQWAENPLNRREREVLQAAAEGLRSRDIAERLFLAPGTVRNYLSAILRKTSSRNRVEAVRKARERGWL
jgi:two-component system, NarL family, response regulator DesR